MKANINEMTSSRPQAQALIDKWQDDLAEIEACIRVDPTMFSTQGRRDQLKICIREAREAILVQSSSPKCTCGNNFANPEPYCAVHC